MSSFGGFFLSFTIDQEMEQVKTGKIIIRNLVILYVISLVTTNIALGFTSNFDIILIGFILLIGNGCLVSVGIILMLYWHSKRLNIV